MRIISGTHKGRRIHAPRNLPVRPTTDMAKEALFNILNHRFYFDEIEVLDLFSGIGSISYEFISRGTAHVTAVDDNRNCVKFIHETAAKLDMDIDVLKADCFGFLEKTAGSWDIIFADPPYIFNDEQFKKIVELVFSNELLKENGLLIIEHSKHTSLENEDHFIERKHYGGSAFSFFSLQ